MDRRTTAEPARSGFAPFSDIVKQGILLQAWLGSTGAVEYLKARGIDSKVITRVLGGECLRSSDHAALAQREAKLQPAA